MRKRSELFFSSILVPLDFLCLVAAFVTAFIIRVKIDDRPVAHPISAVHYLEIALLVLPIWIIIFAFSGLYNLSNLRGRFTEIGRVFVAVSGGVMVLILLDFFTGTNQPLFPSKSVPIYAYGFGIVYVLTARLLLRTLQRYLFRFGTGVHRVLIVGSGELAQRIVRDLNSTRSGYRIVAVLDSARGAAKRFPNLPVYNKLETAFSDLQGELDQIVQADSDFEPEEVFEIVSYATNNQLTYRFVPNQFGIFATNSTLGDMAGIPVLEIRLTPLDGWGRIVKRIFDIVGSVGGIIVFSPVFLVIAIAIKLSDNGPVFFAHNRLTRSGKPLRVWKFRTMRWRYCDGPNRPYKNAIESLKAMGRTDLIPEFKRDQKLRDDPRVNRLGRFLRATSLDELPQLFNALYGDLSLVGPRPIVPAELERYGDKGAQLFSLKPGITGLWQISGRNDIGYEERVKLDIYYVENWSLWLDIRILVKTVIAVLGGGGAR